jgi:putative peptidoglycan lipid II flippase
LSSTQTLSHSSSRTIGIASIIWGSSIFLSRIMGLVREQIIGRTLGATRQADLYFASFTLPDFLNYLLAAGALSIVFIPIFLEYVESGECERGWRALSAIANFIAVTGSVAIAVLMIFARPLAEFIAPGFTAPGELDTLARLIRIILPAQFFLVIGGLLMAALQAQDRHILPALAPLIYSTGVIVGGLIGAYFGLGAEGFSWGVLFGSAIGPFALPLYGCVRTKMRWFPIFSLTHDDLKRYIWLSFPIMIGFSIVVVDEWIVKNQASYLPAGALSYLQYGRTLMRVPIGVFGMAIGVASYPTISRMITGGNVVDAYGTLTHALRLMLFMTFAAQICLTLVGSDAAYVIWGLLSDRFTVQDADAVGSVLSLLCLGLGGWAAQTVISRGFYALGSTWLPTIVGTAVAFCTIPLYIVLRREWGAIGLAIASAIAILTYVGVLGWLQRRRFSREAALRGDRLDRVGGFLSASLCMAFATGVAIGGGLAIRLLLPRVLLNMDFFIVLLRSVILCGFGLGIYVFVARQLGVREFAEVEGMFVRRLKLLGGNRTKPQR